MKKNIIVDLGVIVEYLKTGKGVLPTAYEKFAMHISSSTYTELLASKTFNDEKLEKEVIEFVKKYFKVIDVNTEAAMLAAKYIRDYGFTFAHATIAAVAKTNSMPMLTDDKKSFEKVEGLEMVEV